MTSRAPVRVITMRRERVAYRFKRVPQLRQWVSSGRKIRLGRGLNCFFLRTTFLHIKKLNGKSIGLASLAHPYVRDNCTDSKTRRWVPLNAVSKSERSFESR